MDAAIEQSSAAPVDEIIPRFSMDSESMNMTLNETSEGANRLGSKRLKRTPSQEMTKEAVDHDEALKTKLAKIWDGLETEEGFEQALNQTMSLIGKEVDGLVRTGLDAFHHLDQAESQVKSLREELESKIVELKRLRESHEQSQSSASVSDSSMTKEW